MARTKAKTDTDSRKIAVYARKSKVTESGKSIEIQKEKCIALARTHFNVSESDIIIYEDEGKSGFYADRPQYRKMLRDIENNSVRAVICYKIDRISRRTVDLLNLVQQMEQKGIAFISVTDRELDTSTRTGKIMISLLSAIAEFERDIIAERITDNMYELAKEGRWLGGECPLGYVSKRERLTTGGKTSSLYHLEPVVGEQKAVKRLFELFLQIGSFTGTASALNSEGFVTKKGGSFTNIAVKGILQNPVYAVADADVKNYFSSLDAPIWADDKDFDGYRGIMAYNKTEQIKEPENAARALDPKYLQRNTRRNIKDWIIAVGKHKGTISGKDWVMAQRVIAEISKSNSARPKAVSRALLSGLVRCSVCGGKMFVRSETGRTNPDGTPRFRYICGAKYRGKGCCQNSQDLKGLELDNLVLEHICGLISNERSLCKELLSTRSIFIAKSREDEAELAIHKKRLSQIELEIKKQTINLRTAPDSVKESIYMDIIELNNERDEKQSAVTQIYESMSCQPAQSEDVEIALQTIYDFTKLAKITEYNRKLRLINGVIEYLNVEDGVIHIYLKGAEK